MKDNIMRMETIQEMETCQKIPSNSSTPKVLKLQSTNFAKRVLN